MFKRNYLIFTISVIAAFLLIGISLFLKKKEIEGPVIMLSKGNITSGSQDREYWADLLYKITYPVVHNLAEGTLKKNMPLEVPEEYDMDASKVSYLEAVGRTMAGLAPWLALPDDDTKEGKQRKQLRTELLKGISNGFNPQNPDYLNFRNEKQPICEAGSMAQAFLRAPQALWEPLDTETKKRIVTEFKSLRDRNGADNNWVFLAAIREIFLYKIGEQYDADRVNLALKRIKEWYKGDGWYSDGPLFSIDYYNSHVIHPVVVDFLKVAVEKGLSPQADYDLAVKRMSRHAEFLEHIISPEGTYPVFGRSITYRTAAFHALAQTSLMEKLPDYIEPAQVRCGLTAVMHNMYDHGRNFDANGWLVLGYNGHQPLVADGYTSTGSLYMSTLGFLALGLPSSNRFWSDPPADWTSRKAWSGQVFKRDYHVNY
jgi:hypothetical protein